MTNILLWGLGGVAGIYLAVLLLALISQGVAKALLHGLRKTLSRESRALLSIQQETAHYERLLSELSQSDPTAQSGLVAYHGGRSVTTT